ncbi:MAG: LamG domain-containing protein, partial [Paramuribaculum sp.]|nr:LamG domain-containing protein [Paramuribaculum sp.]
MKKFLLLLIAAMLLPVASMAQNKAISKGARGSSTAKTETRLLVSPNVLDALVTTPVTSHTLAAWVKLTDYASTSYTTESGVKNGVIMGYGGTDHANDNGMYNLCINSDGQLSLIGWGVGGTLQDGAGPVSTSTISKNVWHFMAVVIDVENRKTVVYLDGTQFCDKAWSTDASLSWFTNENPYIYFAGWNFPGALDEVQVYNKALSAEDVATAAYNPNSVDGLVAYYTLDEAVSTNQFENKATGATAPNAIWQTASFSGLWANGCVTQSGTSVEAPTLIDSDRVIASDTKYTVTYYQPFGGTITVTNGSTEVASGSEVYEGTVLTVTATPNTGYALSALYANGMELMSNRYTVNSDVTFDADFEEGGEYCTPTPISGRTNGINTSYGGRGITSLAVSSGGNSITVTGQGTTGTRPVYTDRTSNILTVEPGSTVTINAAGSGEWMNTFIFVDFDKNGITNDDRVYVDNLGDNICNTYAGTRTFTVPSDLAPGKYRVRYMVDWDGVSPCQYGQSSDNGEAIIDFLLSVASPNKTYTVTIPEITNGTLVVKNGDTIINNGDKVDFGTVLTLEVTPAEGYELTSLTAGGVAIEGNSFTVKNNVEFGATFVKKTFIVTISEFTNGTVVVKNGDTIINNGDKVDYGTVLTFEVTPVEGYELTSLTAGDVAVENNSFTVKDNVELGATFAKKMLVVFFSKTENGTMVIKNGEQTINLADKVEYGTVLTIETTPAEGYELASITANDEAIEGNSFTVKDNVEFGATFTKKMLTVTIPEIEHGKVVVKNGETEVKNGDKVEYGTVLTFEFIPDEGYEFTGLTAGEVTVEDDNFTINDNVEFNASFAKQTFTVTIPEIENGTVVVKAGEQTIANGDKVEYGTALTFEVTPNEGYELVSLTAGETAVE